MSEIFFKIVQLAHALGARNIKDTPGCWEYCFGSWRLSVNPHKESTKNSAGLELPPFEMGVEYEGWPAAIVKHNDGIVLAGSEGDIIAALDAEISRVAVKALDSAARVK